MALACIRELETIIPTMQDKCRWLAEELSRRGYTVRGRGMMLGIEISNALGVSRTLLQKGFIVLPAGERAEVLGLTPPLTITQTQLTAFLDALDQACA